MLNRILCWAEGSTAEPPVLYSHLLKKVGNLYVIQDIDFKTFLNQHYDPHQRKIVLSGLSTVFGLLTIVCSPGDVLPVCDILMFAQLIPLGQNQQENKIDEDKFETEAWALSAEFEPLEWANFARFLINGPDSARSMDQTVNPNYTYPLNASKEGASADKTKYRVPETGLDKWVIVMRLLRNIFGHQKHIKWQGLADVKARVLSYMKSALNFRRLIECYESCLL
jgi:hypothetical protein